MAHRRSGLIFLAALFWMLPVGWRVSAQGAALAAQPAPGSSEQLKEARGGFVEAVRDGALVSFDEAAGTVTFRPAKPVDTFHQPGPMEDDMIASAVRAAAVADAYLRALKIDVASQGGALWISAGAEAGATQIARVIQLALGVEGVREVRAELPRSLRKAPGV